jgi:hypothetical protein
MEMDRAHILTLQEGHDEPIVGCNGFMAMISDMDYTDYPFETPEAVESLIVRPGNNIDSKANKIIK